jgi:hypothetical protein
MLIQPKIENTRRNTLLLFPLEQARYEQHTAYDCRCNNPSAQKRSWNWRSTSHHRCCGN